LQPAGTPLKSGATYARHQWSQAPVTRPGRVVPILISLKLKYIRFKLPAIIYTLYLIMLSDSVSRQGDAGRVDRTSVRTATADRSGHDSRVAKFANLSQLSILVYIGDRHPGRRSDIAT
jgi:hypothetical protein